MEGIDWQLQAWPVAITQNVHAQVGPQQSHNELTEDKLQVRPFVQTESGDLTNELHIWPCCED